MTHYEGIGSAFAELNVRVFDLGAATIAEVFAALENNSARYARLGQAPSEFTEGMSH